MTINDYKKCNKKIYRKRISCLGTGWENKNGLSSSKKSNIIQLLVSVMFLMFKTTSCWFPRTFNEKTTFEEFKDICEQISEEGEYQYNDEKETLNYWHISNEEYVVQLIYWRNLLHLSLSFINFFYKNRF